MFWFCVVSLSVCTTELPRGTQAIAVADCAAAVMGSHSLPMLTGLRLSMPCSAQSAWSKRWSLENEDLNGGGSLRGSASAD